jgi:hypothetical protein
VEAGHDARGSTREEDVAARRDRRPEKVAVARWVRVCDPHGAGRAKNGHEGRRLALKTGHVYASGDAARGDQRDMESVAERGEDQSGIAQHRRGWGRSARDNLDKRSTRWMGRTHLPGSK